MVKKIFIVAGDPSGDLWGKNGEGGSKTSG